MKYDSWFFVFVLIIGIVTCSKDNSESPYFRPTDHPISLLGNTMRLTLVIPGKGFYSLSADSTTLVCEGDDCNEYLVSESEMNEMARNLSDTTTFRWEIMTSEFPYPEDHCKLLVYGGDNPGNTSCDCMCSIGNGNSAATIIHELAKSLSGDSRTALDEIVEFLTDQT
jgi:hypothetical protein